MIFFFSRRKSLLLPEGTELSGKVREVEEELSSPLDVMGDEEMHSKYMSIMNLNLEERRLLIVWALLDCSCSKVARLFEVDVKTVAGRINEIKNKLI